MVVRMGVAMVPRVDGATVSGREEGRSVHGTRKLREVAVDLIPSARGGAGHGNGSVAEVSTTTRYSRRRREVDDNADLRVSFASERKRGEGVARHELGRGMSWASPVWEDGEGRGGLLLRWAEREGGREGAQVTFPFSKSFFFSQIAIHLFTWFLNSNL